MNDVLSSTDEKRYLAEIERFSQELIDHEAAYHEQLEKGDALGLVPAVVSCTLTFGPGGGHLSGWITYPDNSKLRFYGKVRQSTFLPFAGLCAMPILVWPRISLLNKTANFSAFGTGEAGMLIIDVDRVPISHPWPIVGAGLYSWRCVGDCRFTAQ